MIQDYYNFFSIIIGLIILGVTTWYAVLTRRIMIASNKTYQLSRKSTITEIHSRFQTSMREIQLTFPHYINDNSTELNPSETRSVQLYWYLVFDEFLTCKKLSNDPELNELWDKYYIKGVTSALGLKYFHKEIAMLISANSTFLGEREDFEKEIAKANGGIVPTPDNYKPKTI
jgi:hypothetical protein